jgi:tetratricopeptide (TPR) repeat protein
MEDYQKLNLDEIEYDLVRKPNDAGLLCNKAYALSSLGRKKDALDCYYNILSLVPASGINGLIWTRIGEIHYDMEEYEAAIEAYVSSITCMMDSYASWNSIFNNLGNAYRAIGEYENAIRCYDEGLRLCKECPLLLYNKGLTLRDMHDSTGDEEYLTKAIDCHSKVDFGRLSSKSKITSGVLVKYPQ